MRNRRTFCFWGVLFVLWQATLCAQAPPISLYRVTAGGDLAVGSGLDFGTVAAGDNQTIEMRIVNNGSTPLTVTSPIYAETITVHSGANIFTTESQPSVGFNLAVGGLGVKFLVRFAPPDPGSYQGVLYLFGLSLALKGVSAQGVTVQVQNGASFQTINATSTLASPIDFGAVTRGQSSVKQFALVNATASALTVNSVIASGPGYSVEGLTTPVNIPTGQTSTFAVRLAPLVSGILPGALTIDGRVFKLTAFVTEPPLPTLSFDPNAKISSGQQATVRILLSEASRAVATVNVSLKGLEQDSAIVLLPDGGRTAAIPLTQGATSLNVLLQTGTTTGALNLSADVGLQHIETTLQLAPLSPVVSTVSGTRSGGRLDLTFTGYDNTHATSDAAFWFYDAGGNLLAGPLRAAAPVATTFSTFFGSSKLGGLFALDASFPVTSGDINSIASFEAELTNSQGATHTPRKAFQ